MVETTLSLIPCFDVVLIGAKGRASSSSRPRLPRGMAHLSIRARISPPGSILTSSMLRMVLAKSSIFRKTVPGFWEGLGGNEGQSTQGIFSLYRKVRGAPVFHLCPLPLRVPFPLDFATSGWILHPVWLLLWSEGLAVYRLLWTTSP